MDFITSLVVGFVSGFLLFQAIKAVVALAYRRAREHQLRVDAEIDRLHK